MSDSEHRVSVGEATVFVDNALNLSREEDVGGRLIDDIVRVDGIVVMTLSNGQTFRVTVTELR